MQSSSNDVDVTMKIPSEPAIVIWPEIAPQVLQRGTHTELKVSFWSLLPLSVAVYFIMKNGSGGHWFIECHSHITIAFLCPFHCTNVNMLTRVGFVVPFREMKYL